MKAPHFYFPIVTSILLIIHEKVKSVNTPVNITKGFLYAAIVG